MSNFLVSYDLKIRGGKQIRKLACIIQAITPKEAREKVLQKPRKETGKVARLRVSRLP